MFYSGQHLYLVAGPSFLLDVWIVVVVGLWLFFNNFERLEGIVVGAAPLSDYTPSDCCPSAAPGGSAQGPSGAAGGGGGDEENLVIATLN